MTLGDLMDLGFDPTRLKEIEIDDKTYIFERVQARQIHVLEERRELVAGFPMKCRTPKSRARN